jgi:choline dehydrogenase-like flavoprotein
MAARSHDYIIVGAGSAGCVLAHRLSADPACRVLLLEAGGPDRKREIRIPVAFIKLSQSAYDWNYRTSNQPQLSDRELYWPRGKTLGGSSSINGQAWTRGHRVDYDGWAHSCPGWSYDDVLPYFQRAERRVGSNTGGVYGTSGLQFISELRDPNPTTSAFLAACAELGMRRLGELNEPDNSGYFADSGHPASRAAAQRRGCLLAPRQAATQPQRPHRSARSANSAGWGQCHRRGVPGCGRGDPASDRVPRGDPQRRHRQLTATAHALRHRRSRPAARCRRPAAPRAGGRWCEPAGSPGRRDRRSLPQADHTRRGRVPGPVGQIPTRAPRHADLQRERRSPSSAATQPLPPPILSLSGFPYRCWARA